MDDAKIKFCFIEILFLIYCASIAIYLVIIYSQTYNNMELTNIIA